jgi:glycosyltransferase involved in cell wall biosynthesis
MRAADVVVHPSLSEAFSQVLIEAMAVGTPLVSTDVGGAREAIADGETGLLVPPADVGAIVRAVSRLYRDPGLGRRLAAAAGESVRRRFTVEHMVRRQVECYRRMLGRTSAHSDSYVST